VIHSFFFLPETSTSGTMAAKPSRGSVKVGVENEWREKLKTTFNAV
jgi:hypothetical protein